MGPKVFQVLQVTKDPREMQVRKDPRVSKVTLGTREGMVLMVLMAKREIWDHRVIKDHKGL